MRNAIAYFDENAMQNTKYLVLILFTVTVAFPHEGMTAPGTAPTREAGVQLSLTRSNIGGRDIDASEAARTPILSGSVGAFLYLEFLDWNGLGLGFQPELVYTSRGANTELDGVYVDGLRTKYLDVPLSLRVESPDISVARIYAVAGVVPSILLSSARANEDGTTTSTEVRRWDLGLFAGLGASFALTERINVHLEASYTSGLLTIDRTKEFEVLNRTMQLTVGVGYRFGAAEP